jgi:hypothetical protein
VRKEFVGLERSLASAFPAFAMAIGIAKVFKGARGGL